MSTTDHEGPEMVSGGPHPGKSVEVLENDLANARIHLGAARRRRERIKAALKIARAREASEPKPIPENPGWGSFGFNVRFPGEDGRVWPAVGYQFGGEISVVAGKDYWFFESWDGMILWMRDTEKVKAVSRIWRLASVDGSKSVTVR